MRRFVVLLLSCAIVLPAIPLSAAGQVGTGSINGVARGGGRTLANYTVRVRNVQTGQLAGLTTSDAVGSFTFSGLNPANYVIEIVDAAGNVIGTSSALAVAAGATMTVTVNAAAVAAVAAGAGGAGAFFGTTLGIVTIAGAAAGIGGIIIAANQNDASPSN